MKFVLNLFLGG